MNYPSAMDITLLIFTLIIGFHNIIDGFETQNWIWMILGLACLMWASFDVGVLVQMRWEHD